MNEFTNELRCVFCHNPINPLSDHCGFCGQWHHETTRIQLERMREEEKVEEESERENGWTC